MQDSETGEILYPGNRAQVAELRYDKETGEPTHLGRGYIFPCETDSETGEPDCNRVKLHFAKTKFNVPKHYLSPKEERTTTCTLRNSNDSFTLSDCKKVIHLKEEIILGCNKTSHRMFLIPSLFLFFKWTALFISISEIFLHIWAHKKNARNSNTNVYYRSPLHVLTAQFCAVCRYQTEYDNINRFHDQTKHLHENISRVSRSLS